MLAFRLEGWTNGSGFHGLTVNVSGMRPNISGLMYIGLLAAVSGISMLRILVAAEGLPKADFAEYAAVVALGSFLGGILSFGKVEATIKSFPKLAAVGQIAMIRDDARTLMLLLAKRSLAISLPLIAFGHVFSTKPALTLGAGFFYAFGVGCFAILASVQRALSQPRLLLAGTAFRALCAFSITSVMVNFTDVSLWVLLAAECLVMIAASLISEVVIFTRSVISSAADSTSDRLPAMVSISSDSGLIIFFAFTLIAAPVYLDRFIVNMIFNTDDAARYAIFGVFLLVPSLLVNTICQRVGPDIVKMVSSSTNRGPVIRYMATWSLVPILIWGIFLFIVYLSFNYSIVPDGLLKYKISSNDLIPIFLLGIGAVSSILEFYMMALDRERDWLALVITYIFTVFLIVLIVDSCFLKLNTFIWLMASARIFYLLLMFKSSILSKGTPPMA